MHEAIALKGAQLKTPAFKGRNRKQIHPLELKESRALASVRIHVERVIGNVRKKYKILQQSVHHGMMSPNDRKATTLDKAVAVCCALHNMNPSIVPSDK